MIVGAAGDYSEAALDESIGESLGGVLTAFRIADQVGLLYEGKIVEASAPEVFRASKHPAVLEFLKQKVHERSTPGQTLTTMQTLAAGWSF